MRPKPVMRKIAYEHTVHAVAVITVTINIVLAISPMNVTINSTISSGQLVCPGDQVNFTCETRGSDIIAWTSKEYIGSGGARVEFSFLDVKTMKVDQNTVATLISADNVNGIRTLISRLTITVSPSYQNPSITCLHVGRLINATISFVVPEIPGIVLEAIAIELLGTNESGCVIFTQWERPNNVNDSYISHYIIDDGRSNTSYITSEWSRVIYLSICVAQSLFIRAFDRCNCDGAIAKVPIQFRSVLRTTTIATDVTDATHINPTTANPTSTGNIQSADAIGIGATALIFAIISLIAVVVIYCRWINLWAHGKYVQKHGEHEPEHHQLCIQNDSQETEFTLTSSKATEEAATSAGEQKLSVIEDKVDRVIIKELEGVRQSLQDMQKHQEEKSKALMEEIQLLKVGEQKLSAIEAKVDRIITKELEDVRQSLQDVIKSQEEKIMKEIQLLKKQVTQEQEAAKSAISSQLKDPELEVHDEGKELGAVPAEMTEIVETSDDREEAVEKSEMPETTDSEVTYETVT